MGGELAPASDFQMIPGPGRRAGWRARRCWSATPELLHEHGVSMTPPFPAEEAVQNGCTVIYLAADGGVCGLHRPL